MRCFQFLSRAVLCASLSLTSFSVQAQSVRDVVAAQDAKLKALQQQVESSSRKIVDLQSSLALLTDMFKQTLATQAADRAMRDYKDNPALLPELLETKRLAVEEAIKAVADIPDGAIPVKDAIEACLVGIKEASVTPLVEDKGAKIEKACPEKEARRLLSELEKARREAVNTWKSCVETISTLQGVGPVNLPLDPAGMSKDSIAQTKTEMDRLVKVLETAAGPAKDCGNGLKSSFEKIQNAETAASALSAALSMAGSVCMMSGGNPVVCGGMFAVALLLSLFDNKGGGNGDGTGDGTGPDQGGGMAGKTVDTTTCTGDGCDAPTPAPGSAEPLCGAGCIIGDPNLTGGIVCAPVSATAMDCAMSGTTEPKVRLDAKRRIADKETAAQTELTAMISSQQLPGVYFCTDMGRGKQFLYGLIVPAAAAGKSFQIAVDYQDAPPSFFYPSAMIETPKADIPRNEVCNKSFGK